MVDALDREVQAEDPLRPEGITTTVSDDVEALLAPIDRNRVSYLMHLRSGVNRLRNLGFSREEISAYSAGNLKDAKKQVLADALFIDGGGDTEDASSQDRLFKEYEVLTGAGDRSDYITELQSRLSQSDTIPQKYNGYISKLIADGKIHNYMFVGEGGHGKAILVFDYYGEETKISIIKLSKHKSEGMEVVGNFVEEAAVQLAVSLNTEGSDLAIQKVVSTPRVELKVPKLYIKGVALGEHHQSGISSEPQQGILSMEYTNGETIESLLWLADYYESHLKNVKKILKKHRSHPYIGQEIIKKLELHGYDFETPECQTNHIIRLLTKKDIIELLKAEGVKISDHPKNGDIPEKQHKHGVNYDDPSDLSRAIIIFLKIHGAELGIQINNEMEVQSIAKEALVSLKSFVKVVGGRTTTHPHKPGTLSLKHRDLNGSNIMIDFSRDTKKLLLWIIDYGATEETNKSGGKK